MIIVNTPGAGTIPYSQLLHAEWHGLTLTDLVFPSFLFAMGTAIPFASRKWQGVPKGAKVIKIFRRAILIFLVGYLLNWYTSMHWSTYGELVFTELSGLRIAGVLQRIALCYLFAAFLAEYYPNRILLFSSILMLAAYWVILYGGGTEGEPLSISSNVVGKVDRVIIGENRMYREHGVLFDPEGILSTLPSIVNVIAGVLAGRLILEKRPPFETTTMLLVNGCVLVSVAICWSWLLPFNKKLWTSSFALCTVAIDLVVLGLLFYFQEIKRIKAGVHFLSVFGRNPLAIYVFSNLLLIIFILPVHDTDLSTFIGVHWYQRLLPGPPGSLLFAVSVALLCWLFGWILNKNKIYIRL
jgi:predicted acyltransferase